MKRSLLLFSVVLFAQVASAATQRTVASAPASSGGTKAIMGAGLSSFGGGPHAAFPALSGLIELVGSKLSIQPLFSVEGSDPFEFSVGGIARYTVAGSDDAGFHVGGGVTLGTSNSGPVVIGPAGVTSGNEFFLNILPVMGIHFALSGALSAIHVGFDGGLIFHVTPHFEMAARPYSALLGANIHYMF